MADCNRPTWLLDLLCEAEARGVEVVNEGGVWVGFKPVKLATPAMHATVRRYAAELKQLLKRQPTPYRARQRRLRGEG